MLDRRMKALNYLGSLLTQNVVKIPALLIQQCLGLIMAYQEKRQIKWHKNGESMQIQKQGSGGTNTAAHKVFNHCLY